MRKVGIYCRISQDRTGAGLGVARQEADCRALVERRGWTVADVYADNDVSAYSGKRRPQWERMLEDIRNGFIDAVVCWHIDRLTRTPLELEGVIALAERHGVELATVTGEIDLATPSGKMVARMLGAAARGEAEHKAERQARQRRQNAEMGKVSGGGARPYGYAEDRVTIVEDEADIIREVAKRMLLGESQSSICRDLEERDVRTPKGGYWKPTTLRRLMASARISGRREHTPRKSFETTRPLLGEIVADAVWPEIITVEQSDQLRALLSDPDRAALFAHPTGRTYLLSGILTCAKPKDDGTLCGWRMSGRPKSGTPRYVCHNTPGSPACGGTATVASRTDEHVRDMILTALASPEMLHQLTTKNDQDTGLAALIAEDEKDLAELAVMAAKKQITRAEWMAARTVVEKRLEENRAKQVRQTGAPMLLGFIGTFEDMTQRWKKSLNDSQRRAIVAATVHKINVYPADPRKKWDPDRFEFDWVA
ncbi:recombinase family protein [Actinospica durhamensis]|uniref:Recombinase family protein n=1 Tax=Actinospica durhamensis TaxID=1508375 RepID=A0A941ITY2_9ACTN|nr:recombinase family protein [Actinospica durhamensis]MBR7838272.1 recombinase family protein [Actinospica durhamensis]